MANTEMTVTGLTKVIQDISDEIYANILKEFIAQKEWVYPPNESMRIIMDMIIVPLNIHSISPAF